MLLLDLPDELLGLVLDGTEQPMGLRLASKRFASNPRGKANVREFQRRALRVFGAIHCSRDESWWMDTHERLSTELMHFHQLGMPRYFYCTYGNRGVVPSSLRTVFLVYTQAEADKMRDHLVAQRPLLQRELTEHCRSWYLEIGRTLPESSKRPLDQISEYLEHKMKLPAGTLNRFRMAGSARKWLWQRVNRAEAAIRLDLVL